MRIQRSVIVGIGAIVVVSILGLTLALRNGWLGSDDAVTAAPDEAGLMDDAIGETDSASSDTSVGTDQSSIGNATGLGEDSDSLGSKPDESAFVDVSSPSAELGDEQTQVANNGDILTSDSGNSQTAVDSKTDATSSTAQSQESTTTSVDSSTDNESDTTAATTKPSSTNVPTTKTSTKPTTRRTTTTKQSTTTARRTTTTRPTTTRPTTTRPTTTRPTTTRPPTSAAPSTQAPSGVGRCAAGAEFERTFRDDFNGSAVNQSNWTTWNSTGNAGNGLRRSSAVSVANGLLTISASNQGGQVVSGGMSHNGNQQYGRYSFRVRTDVDPSRTMSGVVLTWPASQRHPEDGENNIYETLPHEESATRNPFYSFVHKPYGAVTDQERFVHRADANQWQTMTMEWTPSRITITRQGASPQTVTETSADLIPDNPHIFTVQFDATKPQIASDLIMQVDWVEIYKYCG